MHMANEGQKEVFAVFETRSYIPYLILAKVVAANEAAGIEFKTEGRLLRMACTVGTKISFDQYQTSYVEEPIIFLFF